MPANEFPLRMSAAEVTAFTDLLQKSTCYLEWGAGGSTLAAVRSKVPSIVSIDTHAAWLDRLQQNSEIAAALTANRLLLRHIDIGPVGPW